VYLEFIEDQSGLSPPTVAVIVAVVLLLGRYLYLRSQRSPEPAGPRNTLPAPTAASVTPLPSSPVRWWPSRHERLLRQTEYVRSHTDYILARIEEAKAMGGLVRARVELSDLLASLTPPAPTIRVPNSTAPTTALTLTEIAEIVDALPNASHELRTLLMELLSGRLAEKVAR
jgi:hypothetical protein